MATLVPVDHDPFATPAASKRGPWDDYAKPSASAPAPAVPEGPWTKYSAGQPRLVPVDHDPFTQVTPADQFDTAFGADAATDRPAMQKPMQEYATRRLASQSPLGPAGFGDVVNDAVTFGLSKDAAALAHALPGEVLSWFTGAEHDFGGEYNRAREIERARLDQYAQEHPTASTVASGVGTVGNLALTAPAAMLRAAPLTFGRTVGAGAKAGTTIGALSGLGESEGDLTDRGVGMASGAITGGLTGAALPVLAEGAVRGFQKAVAAPLRGLLNPEKEAARRLALAREADAGIPQPGLSAADEADALTRGQPIYNIDRGGEMTHALAHSAANQSPLARAALTTAVEDRFAGQGERTVDTVRRIVGNATTADSREALQAAARTANRPAYARAYSDPNARAIWDEGLQELTGAPVVQDAIRQAALTGRNRAALDGFAPIKNPFRTDPATGRLSLAGDAKPTLQFWDHVKRNLDKAGTREAQQASRVLRDHLDEIVPSYATARAGAARYFGAESALEAGDKFLMSRMGNDEARRALAKMTAPERKLFGEGFADSLARRIAEVGDRRNAINAVFLRSPASRQRIQMALGPQRAKELESFLRVEDLLDKSRKALTGNSTTARQLVEMGLAGSSGAYGLGTGDWHPSGAVIAGLLMRRGYAGINRRVAQRVGQMLASPDAALVHRGIQMVTRNKAMFDALRSATVPLASATANPEGRALAPRQRAQ